MRNFAIIATIVLSLLTPAGRPPVATASESHDEHGHDEHGHEEAAHAEGATGPHGGRLLEGDHLQAEVTIFEEGVPPQMRVWLYDDGKPLPATDARVTITLQRLGRAPETIAFSPRGDFLVGDRVVEEPHSFVVEIDAVAGSRKLHASYETFEARVVIAPEVAAAGGVTSMVAGPRELERSLHLTGRIGIPSDRLADLHPRFAGLVREAVGGIGDKVERGAVLATLESNATLARYTVASPLSGVILDRRVVVGATVAESDVLYTVADLSRVWADFDVYGSDTSVVHVGEDLVVRDDAHAVEAAAKVSYVSPLRDVHTQTTLARAVLDNADGRWSPGAFVSATIALEEKPAAVAVPPSALQTWRGNEAVFILADGIWEARPVLVGRRGDEWIELLSGVDAGTTVATGNTFLLRAEIEKAGASHDH